MTSQAPALTEWSPEYRDVGPVLVHRDRRAWIVFYENEEVPVLSYFMGYVAKRAPKKDQAPWSIDNRRTGESGKGFPTWQAAAEATERALCAAEA